LIPDGVAADISDPSSYMLREGDLLIARSGNTVGKSYLHPKGAEPSLFAGYLIRFQLSTKRINPRFAFFFTKSERYDSWLDSKRRVAGQPNINGTEYASLEIPLPPLPEQHRIVEILDQADALRRQRGEADDVSKRILPALFQEMFGSDDFPRIPLSEILISIKGGWSPVCENRSVEDGEWGVLKLGAATYCEYRPHENKALRSDCEPRKELEVREGDLLFTRKNTRELVGAAAYVFETPSRLMTPDLIFRLIPNPEIIDPIYLWQAMIQPEARMMIQAQASGAAASMVNISQNRLMPLEFPVPPISAQRRFADAVQTYRNSAKQQSTSAATLETLFQTLLHRAFDGSLTAKWREGHAKELLQEMNHLAKA
jgi:type I restriction enzyme S subunit